MSRFYNLHQQTFHLWQEVYYDKEAKWSLDRGLLHVFTDEIELSIERLPHTPRKIVCTTDELKDLKKLLKTIKADETKSWKQYEVEREANSIKVGPLGSFTKTRWLTLLKNGLRWIKETVQQSSAENAYENYMAFSHPNESVDLRTNCYERHSNLKLWILAWATLCNLLQIVWSDAIDNLVEYDQLFVRLIEKLTTQDYTKAISQITLQQVDTIKHRLFYMYDFLPENDDVIQVDYTILEALITDVMSVLTEVKNKVEERNQMLIILGKLTADTYNNFTIVKGVAATNPLHRRIRDIFVTNVTFHRDLEILGGLPGHMSCAKWTYFDHVGVPFLEFPTVAYLIATGKFLYLNLQKEINNLDFSYPKFYLIQGDPHFYSSNPLPIIELAGEIPSNVDKRETHVAVYLSGDNCCLIRIIIGGHLFALSRHLTLTDIVSQWKDRVLLPRGLPTNPILLKLITRNLSLEYQAASVLRKIIFEQPLAIDLASQLPATLIGEHFSDLKKNVQLCGISISSPEC